MYDWSKYFTLILVSNSPGTEAINKHISDTFSSAMLIYLFHVHDEYYQRRKIFPFFQFSSWVNHNPIYTSHELINIHQNNGNCKKENNKKGAQLTIKCLIFTESCELLLISQTKTRLSYNFEGETWENNCRKTLIFVASSISKDFIYKMLQVCINDSMKSEEKGSILAWWWSILRSEHHHEQHCWHDGKF